LHANIDNDHDTPSTISGNNDHNNGVTSRTFESKTEEKSSSSNEKQTHITHTVNEVIHYDICCVCEMESIIGNRHKCSTCEEYDLCELCYSKNDHIMDHMFIKVTSAPLRSIQLETKDQGNASNKSVISKLHKHPLINHSTSLTPCMFQTGSFQTFIMYVLHFFGYFLDEIRVCVGIKCNKKSSLIANDNEAVVEAVFICPKVGCKFVLCHSCGMSEHTSLCMSYHVLLVMLAILCDFL
jgi:hypothetical protein